mgnify:CR=1 FL=1
MSTLMTVDPTPIVEEVVVERQRDPLSTFLAFSIFFVISVALTGVLYLLVTNVLDPAAPRTAAEAQLIAVENAVKTQVWIAISAYVLVAIVKKRLAVDASLYTILQVLSLTLFEKTTLIQLLNTESLMPEEGENPMQLNLFT